MLVPWPVRGFLLSCSAKFHTWGAGRSVVSSEDKREVRSLFFPSVALYSDKRVQLKKARKEGRLNEAMLDRRSKLKSDRFC